MSDEDFAGLVREFDLSAAQSKSLRVELDNFVDSMAVLVDADQQNSMPQRERIQLLQKMANTAERLCQDAVQLDDLGLLYLQPSAAQHLVPLLSLNAIEREFPADMAMMTATTDRNTLLNPANANFLMWPVAALVLLLVLDKIAFSLHLAVARAQARPKETGRPNQQWRDHALGVLARLFSDFVGPPKSTPTGRFAIFCNYVLQSIGWPQEGIESALPSVVAEKSRKA
jgi:hypothetical protein